MPLQNARTKPKGAHGHFWAKTAVKGTEWAPAGEGKNIAHNGQKMDNGKHPP